MKKNPVFTFGSQSCLVTQTVSVLYEHLMTVSLHKNRSEKVTVKDREIPTSRELHSFPVLASVRSLEAVPYQLLFQMAPKWTYCCQS